MWTPIPVYHCCYLCYSSVSITIINSLLILIVAMRIISPKKIHLEFWRDSAPLYGEIGDGLVSGLPHPFSYTYYTYYTLKYIKYISNNCRRHFVGRCEITIPSELPRGYNIYPNVWECTIMLGIPMLQLYPLCRLATTSIERVSSWALIGLVELHHYVHCMPYAHCLHCAALHI